MVQKYLYLRRLQEIKKQVQSKLIKLALLGIKALERFFQNAD